jgi:plastocyanin
MPEPDKGEGTPVSHQPATRRRPTLRILAGMNTLLRPLAGALLPASLALACLGALAADLQVTVTTPDGKPAPDVVVALLPTGGGAVPVAPAPEPVLIVQREIRFEPYVTAVPLGSTVRFVNRDRFDHHVRSVAGGPLGSIAPAKTFEFRLAAARAGRETSADVVIDAPGATGIGCHLHGSMRAHIYASPTPWVAVTDASGRARLRGVPEGAANLRLWHPDQLVAQAPRPRPAPRPSLKGEYE